MFDKKKFYLGTLCKRKHSYRKYGKSMRYISNDCCYECKEEKSKYDKELYQENKEEINKKNKKYNSEHKERVKDNRLQRLYGITSENYNKMYDEQEGCCYICGIYKEKEGNRYNVLCVDHDHEIGKVRGLLCHRCNKAIGLLEDDEQLLLKAIEYLKKFNRGK